MQEKLLNLYLLTQYWNDGLEDHALFRALVMATGEDHARTLVFEYEQDGDNGFGTRDDFERIANWRVAECKMIGWATGKEQIPGVIFVQ